MFTSLKLDMRLGFPIVMQIMDLGMKCWNCFKKNSGKNRFSSGSMASICLHLDS